MAKPLAQWSEITSLGTGRPLIWSACSLCLCMEWHRIPSSDIPPEDGVRKSRIAGKTLCIVRQDGVLHVTGAKCPHAGADLSAGWCEGGQLVCPRHRHTFDLTTGRGAPGQGNYIRVYATREADGEWWVEIPRSWWKQWWR